MLYEAEISRKNPTCFLFMIDQSGSMYGPVGGQPDKSKAQCVADAINRLLQNLVLKCAKAEGVRDYFQIGVIGYGEQVTSALGGALAGHWLLPISQIANNPLRLEDRVRQVSDGAGGILQQPIKFPVWVEPLANEGTPMREAFQTATAVLADFLQRYHACYPPIVLNITDGEANDDPRAAAQQLTALGSTDGNVLLFNLHLSSLSDKSVEFPAEDRALPDDEYARQLFHMSSILPPKMAEAARRENERFAGNGARRGFVFNADPVSLVRFLEIGTQGSRNLR